METVLITCQSCGHRERDSAGNALMAKIRMWNHLHRTHPSLVDHYRDAVEVRAEKGPARPLERKDEDLEAARAVLRNFR